MLFTQIEFLFLLVGVLGFLLAVRHHRARKLMLLAASYYFYAYWDWRFLGLIFVSTVIDYTLARLMVRTEDPQRRKLLLLISLAANLGLLGFFKYANFFIESFNAAFDPLVSANLETLSWIILPVGISFYTFQTLSYTIDVYRGRLDTCDDFFDFALFVAFFPQLVAGPIVRASEFLPQLQSDRSLTWNRTAAGFSQFTVGLFKKVFIADRIAVFVDTVFGNPELFGVATAWLAVLAYAIQIYCDFSGYSDMAIGIARTLGYDFNENFDHPYISRSITEFWQRWHISLSSWLRDYLYIPLGGNRRGSRRTYINLALTMLLGGLWHGAAWTFVVWGVIHGSVLAAERFFSPYIKPRLMVVPRPLWAALGWAWTMLWVNIAWVFFRAPDFASAAHILDHMFLSPAGIVWLPSFVIFAVVFMGLAQAIQVSPLRHWRTPKPLSWSTPTGLFLMWWLVLTFPAKGFTPFIYFQF